MQGGCLCENAPGLRVDYSNIEIAAAPAPRPQVIVGATGDWTKRMMEVEGPAIESIYKLFRAEDKFHYNIFDYDHNYNKTTREFVYASFGKWLLKEKNPDSLKEQPYKKEPDSKLRVFPGDKLPPTALKEPEVIQSMVRIYSEQLDRIKPIDSKSLKKWKEQMLPAWEHAVHLQHVRGSSSESSGEKITLRRQPDNAEVTLWVRESDGSAARKGKDVVILRVGYDRNDTLGESLNGQGITVASIMIQRVAAADEFKNYFHTYNRTYAQDAVANYKVATEYLRDRFQKSKIVFLGRGKFGGRTALLAAPLADAVVADALQLDESEDAGLLEPGTFIPGIRRLGSLQGIAALAAPNPIFIHNIKNWDHDWLDSIYEKKRGRFRHQADTASDTEIVDWITNIANR
jgi:hypothetical protein